MGHPLGIHTSCVHVRGKTRAFCFLLCASESFGIGIEAGELNFRKPALQHHEKRASAAADFERAVARFQRSMIEQRAAGAINAEDFCDDVVKRKKEVVTGGGKVVAVRTRSRHGKQS